MQIDSLLAKIAESFAAKDYATVIKLTDAASALDADHPKPHLYRALANGALLIHHELKDRFHDLSVAELSLKMGLSPAEQEATLAKVQGIWTGVHSRAETFTDSLNKALELDPSLARELPPESVKELSVHWREGIFKILSAIVDIYRRYREGDVHGLETRLDRLGTGFGRAMGSLQKRDAAPLPKKSLLDSDPFADLRDSQHGARTVLKKGPSKSQSVDDLVFPRFDLSVDSAEMVQLADDAVIDMAQMSEAEGSKLFAGDSSSFMAFTSTNMESVAEALPVDAEPAPAAPARPAPQARQTQATPSQRQARPPAAQQAQARSAPTQQQQQRPKTQPQARQPDKSSPSQPATKSGPQQKAQPRTAPPTQQTATPRQRKPAAKQQPPPTSTRSAESIPVARQRTPIPNTPSQPPARPSRPTARAMPQDRPPTTSIPQSRHPTPAQPIPQPQHPASGPPSAGRAIPRPAEAHKLKSKADRKPPPKDTRRAPSPVAQTPLSAPEEIDLEPDRPVEIPELEVGAQVGFLDAEEVKQPTVRAKVIRRLEAWAQSQPYHPFPDLADRIVVDKLTRRFIYLFRIAVALEERRLIESLAPYRDEQLPLSPLRDAEIQRWQYRVDLANDFKPRKAAFRLAETYEKVSCATCAGRGKHTCKDCNGVGEASCPKCHGTGAFPPEADSMEHPCGMCKGRKLVPCAACAGRGFHVCAACKGAGYQLRCLELHVRRAAKPELIVFPGEYLPKGLAADDLDDPRFRRLLVDEEFHPFMTAQDVVRLCPDELRETMVDVANDFRNLESDERKIRAQSTQVSVSEVLHLEYTLNDKQYSCDFLGGGTLTRIEDFEVFPRKDPLLDQELDLRVRADWAAHHGRANLTRRIAKKLLKRHPDDEQARELLAYIRKRANRDYRLSFVFSVIAALSICHAALVFVPELLLLSAIATLVSGAVVAFALSRVVGTRLDSLIGRALVATLLTTGATAASFLLLIAPPGSPVEQRWLAERERTDPIESLQQVPSLFDGTRPARIWGGATTDTDAADNRPDNSAVDTNKNNAAAGNNAANSNSAANDSAANNNAANSSNNGS